MNRLKFNFEKSILNDILSLVINEYYDDNTLKYLQKNKYDITILSF